MFYRFATNPYTLFYIHANRSEKSHNINGFQQQKKKNQDIQYCHNVCSYVLMNVCISINWLLKFAAMK